MLSLKLVAFMNFHFCRCCSGRGHLKFVSKAASKPTDPSSVAAGQALGGIESDAVADAVAGYRGPFLNDMYHGEAGVLVLADGTRFEGVFERNFLVNGMCLSV